MRAKGGVQLVGSLRSQGANSEVRPCVGGTQVQCVLRSVGHRLGLAGVLFFLPLVPPCFADPWSDVKGRASEAGITPTLVYDGTVAANFSGGERDGIAFAGAAHLQILGDGTRLVDAPGLTIYADILNTHGKEPSALVGDIQGVSNIAAPPDIRIYEAWAQYNWRSSSLLIGRYDLNTEFYRLASSSVFLNSSFGIGPEFSQSGPAGASIYPDTSLGARIAYKPDPNVVIRVALMDGAPVERPQSEGGLFSSRDGVFIMSELAILTRPGADTQPGAVRSLIGRMSTLPPYEDKFAIGGWYYTSDLNDLSERNANGSPVKHAGSGGAYALLDERLLEIGNAHINGFLQAGLGDGRVNRVDSYVGLGLAATGIITERPNDQLGLALAVARNGSHFLAASENLEPQYATTEATLEMTYVCQATSWLAIQPDLQYVWHPGAVPGLHNAAVVQVEFETSF